ncbi:Alginate biosynthesis protein AlgA [Burkholderia glumae]|nr:Alginate biosynthesis protein AlgA [Burkholderia glumae]
MSIFPVILCGGSGTRLWPMSRGGYPKQYLKLTGDDTLIQQTALRVRHLPDATKPIILTNNEQRFLVAEQLRQVGIEPSSIVLEPVGRNTAPAIAVAAHMALKESPDALLLVLPSDHAILNQAAFAAAAQAAAAVASEGCLVTFGIPPTAHIRDSAISTGASRSTMRRRPTAWTPLSKNPTWRPRRNSSNRANTTGTAACSC